MSLNTYFAGGFTAVNSGHISDSYCSGRLSDTGKGAAGGFCAENKGIIKCCASDVTIRGRGKHSGFCARQSGSALSSFWIRHKKDSEKMWLDWSISASEEQLKDRLPADWDFDNVWKYEGKSGQTVLALYDRKEKPDDTLPVMEIGTVKDLLALAEKVNSGSAEESVVYRLTADLDLGGRKWIPIGLDANTSFHGFFDGDGHTIRNFVVRSSGNAYAGFFGYIGSDGTAANLNIDCQLNGRGSYAAPFCACNEGRIINCTAVSFSDGSRFSGGFAADNRGTIARCAAYFGIRSGLCIPWQAAALLLAVLCIPLPVLFYMNAQHEAQEIFAPVILDPNAEPIEPGAEITPDTEESSDSNSTFIMNAEMYVSTENYTGAIGLKCPTWSSRGFVATVFLSAEDQARIGVESDSEIVLYQSGLLSPGYEIDNITLGRLPDGSVLPSGEYELSVLFEFYDMNTNEKSSTNTVVPLKVTVE